jgi:hypothetical protein
VFPFRFDASSFDWSLLVRAVLVVAIGGSVIGMAVHVGSFLRAVVRGDLR